ncbi:MAG: TetR/AcrR family transcriptional regulator [Aquisalinus sp.]|nr:TetR/AcrR family transcriptional regulator [Aquisalinus sp.]
MSQREIAKQENRQKIKDAAANIIRREGIEKLTMRYLADIAGVSLRTPYNLFGSKTEVLFALLEDAGVLLTQGLISQSEDLAVGRLFSSLNAMEAHVRKDDEFYQTVYWGVMASDQVEIRRTGYERLIELSQGFVAEAIANKEINSDINSDEFGKHIGILLMSILGMWGSGYFGSKECAAHIRRSWCASFLTVATRKSKQHLMNEMSH